MTSPMFEKIALVGIGLIGSSLARIIRREGLAAMSPSRRAARPRWRGRRNSVSASPTPQTQKKRSAMPT